MLRRIANESAQALLTTQHGSIGVVVWPRTDVRALSIHRRERVHGPVWRPEIPSLGLINYCVFVGVAGTEVDPCTYMVCLYTKTFQTRL